MHTILLETSGLSASAKTKIELQVWWGLRRAKLVLSGEGLIKCVGHTFEILWELVLGKRCLSISEKWCTPGPPYHSIIYHRPVCPSIEFSLCNYPFSVPKWATSLQMKNGWLLLFTPFLWHCVASLLYSICRKNKEFWFLTPKNHQFMPLANPWFIRDMSFFLQHAFTEIFTCMVDFCSWKSKLLVFKTSTKSLLSFLNL